MLVYTGEPPQKKTSPTFQTSSFSEDGERPRDVVMSYMDSGDGRLWKKMNEVRDGLTSHVVRNLCDLIKVVRSISVTVFFFLVGLRIAGVAKG